MKDTWDRGEWVRPTVRSAFVITGLLLYFFILLLFNTSPAPPANKHNAAGKLCQGWVPKNGAVLDTHTHTHIIGQVCVSVSRGLMILKETIGLSICHPHTNSHYAALKEGSLLIDQDDGFF